MAASARRRQAKQSGIEPVGVKPLESERTPDGGRPRDVAGPERFAFPALARGEGGDATWSETLDTLRPQRRRNEKLWVWRREAPIRPLVFEDPGTMDDEVVQLHLAHRVLRRLLGVYLWPITG
jgi:hypothetical protein